MLASRPPTASTDFRRCVAEPSVGNAVENDAGITSFELQNSIGAPQSLSGAESGQDINLIGQIRLEDLNEAPDPSSYFLTLELKHVNTTDGNITVEWEEVANRSGVIGGDFNWNVDLGAAAGSETYRFAARGYEGGELLCPPSQYNPDETCAIPFDITIDTYEPNLLDLQVLSPGTDANVDSNWRTLLDDTWVVPQANQQIRMSSQDLPSPLPRLTSIFGLRTTTIRTATVCPMQMNTSPSPSTATAKHQRPIILATTTTWPTKAWKGRCHSGLKGTTLQATPLTVAVPALTTTRLRTSPCRPRRQ